MRPITIEQLNKFSQHIFIISYDLENPENSRIGKVDYVRPLITGEYEVYSFMLSPAPIRLDKDGVAKCGCDKILMRLFIHPKLEIGTAICEHGEFKQWNCLEFTYYLVENRGIIITKDEDNPVILYTIHFPHRSQINIHDYLELNPGDLIPLFKVATQEGEMRPLALNSYIDFIHDKIIFKDNLPSELTDLVNEYLFVMEGYQPGTADNIFTEGFKQLYFQPSNGTEGFDIDHLRVIDSDNNGMFLMPENTVFVPGLTKVDKNGIVKDSTGKEIGRILRLAYPIPISDIAEFLFYETFSETVSFSACYPTGFKWQIKKRTDYGLDYLVIGLKNTFLHTIPFTEISTPECIETILEDIFLDELKEYIYLDSPLPS